MNISKKDDNGMKWTDDGRMNVPYYLFEQIEKTGVATCAFTTRKCRMDGKELDYFQPLLRNDSDPLEVGRCVSMLARQFGVKEEMIITSAQKHTANIHKVTMSDLNHDNSRPLQYVDGLITDFPNVMLQTFGADCPSVYLLDPVRPAIGLCHSGRKGTGLWIAAAMLEEMINEYGTKPENVLAAISPGICAPCYEVGEDVAVEFINDYAASERKRELPHGGNDRDLSSIVPFVNGKYHIDINKAIERSLMEMGVSSSNIEISHLCTKCRMDIFYSFRGEGKISNENSAIFMIK